MALLLPLLAAGCAGPAGLSHWWHNGYKLGPEYQRPAVAVADQWLDASDSQVLAVPLDDPRWWLVFNDPTLSSLVELAEQQNVTLREAAFRILEARARRNEAAGELFPQTQQLTADYRSINTSSLVANPAFFQLDFDHWNLGAGVAWEVDLWGRFRRSVESHDARLEASVRDYDDVLVMLQAEVASTYIRARTLQSRLEFARANAQYQQRSYELTRTKLAGGRITRLDVLQAESVWRSTQAQIPSLIASLWQAENDLALLLGMPPHAMDSLLAGRPAIPAAPAEVVAGIPAELLRRRPDVLRAEREVAAQSAQLGVTAAEFYPAVSILGTIGWDAEHFGSLLDGRAVQGGVGPSVRWNLLHYGRIQNRLAANDARLGQLIARYEQTVLEANAEADSAINRFLTARQETEYRRRAAVVAEEALAMAQTKYEAGETDYLPLLTANVTLAQAQDDLARVEGKTAEALVMVYKALGGGWQVRCQGETIATSFEPLPAPQQP